MVDHRPARSAGSPAFPIVTARHAAIARRSRRGPAPRPGDEFEDLLELRDPEVQRLIEESRADELAGRVRPAREVLAELGAEKEEGGSESKQLR